MTKIDVKTTAGAKAGTVELDAAIFGIEPHGPVMHQVVTAQLAARRAGAQSTLTRAEVRGGGAKPWRQKGTGRARAGSSNSPNWRGGGVAMAPKPRSYRQRTPKKMVRLALRSALSDRAADGKVIVVDSMDFDQPRTKDAVAALEAIGAEGRVLVVLPGDAESAWKSYRNLQWVHVVSPGELNAYDVLVSDVVVFTRATLPSSDESAPDSPAPTPMAVTEAPDEVEEAEVEEVSLVEDTTVDSDADDEVNATDESPFGEGSARPLDDGSAPSDDYVIKGNTGSMLYHPPESPFYGRTKAEVWFVSAEAAEAAGFSLPASLKKDDAGSDGEED